MPFLLRRGSIAFRSRKSPMARVPLLDDTTDPEHAELINIYRLLLHSPGLAESWFEHSNAVRWKTELDGRLRELVIIRIALVTGADYIVRQHVPALAIAEGLTPEECE